MWCNTRTEQTDTPSEYSNDKSLYCDRWGLYAHCTREQDRNSVAIRSSLFPRQRRAPHHPHMADIDPQVGFPLTDPACDSSHLCVMAVFSWRFTTTHRSLSSERFLRTLNSHFRFSSGHNADSLGHSHFPIVYTVCSLMMTICYSHILIFLMVL